MKRVTVADAPAILDPHEKAFWAIGWNACAEVAEAAVKQARIDALEEAKKAVDSEGFREPESEYEAGYNKACDVCVSAIEYLKVTP